MSDTANLHAMPDGLNGILTATWFAFALIEETSSRFAEQHTEYFPTWASVIAPASKGRDAIGRAPSWSPDASRDTDSPAKCLADEGSAAAQLAALAEAARVKLEAVAGDAADPADRNACLRGAAAAAEIHDLLA